MIGEIREIREIRDSIRKLQELEMKTDTCEEVCYHVEKALQEWDDRLSDWLIKYEDDGK